MLNAIIEIINKAGAGWWVFSTAMLVQASILIALLLLLDLFLRKRVRAVVRYWIWLLVLAKLALPTSLALPTGIGYWLPLTSYQPPAISHQQEQQNFATENTEIQKYNHELTRISTGSQTQINTDYTDLNKAKIQNSPAAPRVTIDEPRVTNLTWQGFAFLGWLAGMAALAIMVIQRVWFVRALVAQSQPANGRLAEAMEECCKKMGMSVGATGGRPLAVELRLTKNMLSPAACGLLRPIILMPESLLENLSRQKLRAVLTHELVHIKRGDLWLNLVQTILQVAYFYNPLVWVANAMIRQVREQAVDEATLVNLGDEAKDYGTTLLDIAEMALSRPHFSLRLVGVVESKKSLAGRIKHIMSRPIPKSAKIGVVGFVAVILTGCVLLPMAKAQKDVTTKPTENTKENKLTTNEHELTLNKVATESTGGTEKQKSSSSKEFTKTPVERVLLPEYFESHTVLSLKTGQLIPQQQADESNEPYLYYGYTFPPGENPRKFTVNNIPENYIGVEAGNMDLGAGDPYRPNDNLWSLKTIDELPKFQPRIKITFGEHTSNGVFIIPPLDRSWPFITAFKGDDGTYGIFEISKVENRKIHVKFKTLNSPEETPQNSERPTINSPFTATLANGVAVELVGVCEHPSKDKQWWKPDGSPLGFNIETQDPSHYEDKNNGYEIAYKFETPDGAHVAQPKIKGSTSQSGLEVKSPSGIQAVRSHINVWGKTTTVKFPVAAGEWKILGRTSGGGQVTAMVGSKKIMFGPAEGTKEKLVVAVTDDLNDYNSEYRLVALDKKGTTVFSKQNWFSNKGIRQHTFVFSGLDPADVKRFEFQTRPYEWVEFKNVSLRPGVKADVKIQKDLTTKPTESTEIKNKLTTNEHELTLNKLATEDTEKNQSNDTKEFTKTLANEVEIKLAGVGIDKNGEKHNEWWQPDGSSIVEAPFTEKGPQQIPDSNQIARAMAFEIVGHDINDTDFTVKIPNTDRLSRWPIDPALEGLGKGKNMFAASFKIDKNTEFVDAVVGVAVSKWQPLVNMIARGGGSTFYSIIAKAEAMAVNFDLSYEKDGQTFIPVAWEAEPEKYAYRIVAIDKAGKIHKAVRTGNSGDRLASGTWVFALPATEIKSFELQSRPYEWVEFKDVQLKSKQWEFTPISIHENQNGNSEIIIMHNVMGKNFSVMAIDANDNQFAPSKFSSQVKGDRTQQTTQFALPLTEIKSFRLQTTRETIDFSNRDFRHKHQAVTSTKQPVSDPNQPAATVREHGGQPAESNSVGEGQKSTSIAQYIEQIKRLQGHKQAAFAFGPQLTMLDPNVGFEIIQKAWSDIKDDDVKTGLMKAFVFADHPKAIDIVVMAVEDNSPAVRSYAFAYVPRYAGKDFDGSVAEFRAWYAQVKGKPVQQIRDLSVQMNRPEVKAKIDKLINDWQFGKLSSQQLRNMAGEFNGSKDPILIPYLISFIEADNSYDSIYWVGHFALTPLTGVQYSEFHDGAWWRRWWEKNKSKYPPDVQQVAIPELKKTAAGKEHVPFPESLDTLDGKLEWIVKQAKAGNTKQLKLSGIAGEIAKHNDAKAIPILIDIIEADNTYDTVYGVGYFGLSSLTGVKYDSSHDGKWWRQWWETNKLQYPSAEKLQPAPIIQQSEPNSVAANIKQ